MYKLFMKAVKHLNCFHFGVQENILKKHNSPAMFISILSLMKMFFLVLTSYYSEKKNQKDTHKYTEKYILWVISPQ
jgi:hypothetical protein